MTTTTRMLLIGLLLTGCKTDPPPAAEQAPAPAEQAPPPVTEPIPPPEPKPTEPPPQPVAEPTPPAGPCKPERLHAGRYPKALALDATHLYFVQGSELVRMPRTGGPTQRVLDPVVDEAPLLLDTDLVTCQRGKQLGLDLVRVGKAGTDPRVIGKVSACTLARVGQQLYVPITLDGYKPWLARLPETGGPLEPLLELERSVAEIVADATHVYYTTERDELYRFDPTTRTATLLSKDREGMMELGMTTTYLAWLEYANLMYMPKSGPPAQPMLAANFQDVLGFAASGDELYWASVSEESWRRLALGDTSMRSFSVPAGTGDIVVDGKRVFWTEFDAHGGIFTLDTSQCGDDVLVPIPTVRGITGPEHEDALRFGYASGGQASVEVRDLSSDEHRALLQVGTTHGYGRVPNDAGNLPPRFAIGQPYKVATTAGVFDATISGFELGSGGEGLHFYLILRIADAVESPALASKPDGAKLGPLREPPASPESPDPFLAGVRAEFDDAGLDGSRVEPDAINVLRGKFPAPHVAVITVELEPEPTTDDEPQLERLSALLFADADGKITGTLYAPDQRLSSYALGLLVDIDGDGIDELLFDSSYYEGGYTLLLEWVGDQPTATTLAGDGA